MLAPFDLDGRYLSFPGTGIAQATAELVLALSAHPFGRGIRVFVENREHLADFQLLNTSVEWVVVPHRHRRPDYVDRWFWGRAVLRAQGRDRRPLFIPYMYNYGALRQNLVFIHDLVYRLIPDYGPATAKGRRWWDWRGRLPFRPWVRRHEERICARARHVVVQTEYVRRQVRDILQVPEARLLRIYRGASSLFLGHLAAPAALPPGLPPRFVLYCGGYAVRKNIPLLLRACARAAQLEPAFRCVFVGFDAPAQMTSAGLPPGQVPAIIGLPRVDNATLAALYLACEFAVYPSVAEGYGLPPLEAATAGKICLCGDNTSLREVQPEARFRLPDHDEDAWVAALLEHWRNPDETRAAGAAARAWAGKYSWPQTAQILLSAPV